MKTIIALLLVLAFPSLTAWAEDAPPGLLEAIAIQESDRNPLAVNVAGKDYYPATREEAMRIILQAQAAGMSYDVGMFQINSWWIDRYRIAPESLLDPTINRQWGVFVLSQEIARHGLNWKAVGKCHSPDLERGRRYAWKIYRYFVDMEGKEADNGTEHGHKNISFPGGIQRHSGISPQGRIVTFDLQQTGMPRNSGSEHGTPGGPTGAKKD